MNTSNTCATRGTNPINSDNPFWWLCVASCVTAPITDEDPEDPPKALSPFFVDAGHSITEEQLRQCQQCPVRRECLSWAYAENADFGFFGGVSPTTREQYALTDLLTLVAAGRI